MNDDRKQAFLVGAGEAILNQKTMRGLAQATDFILSADGGYDRLQALDIEPDFLVGDFDSSSLQKGEGTLAAWQEAGRLITLPSHKDDTDAAFAMAYLLDHGYSEIYMTGLVGSRLDHSLCNLALLRELAKREARACLLSENNRVFFLPAHSDYRLPLLPPAWYASFICFDPGVFITLEGFEYRLDDWPLPTYYSKAVSNHVLSADNRVRLRCEADGGVFLFYSRDGQGEGRATSPSQGEEGGTSSRTGEGTAASPSQGPDESPAILTGWPQVL